MLRCPTVRQWNIGDGDGTGVTTHTDATKGNAAWYCEVVVAARRDILFWSRHVFTYLCPCSDFDKAASRVKEVRTTRIAPRTNAAGSVAIFPHS